MITYEKANAEARRILVAVMREHHSQLIDAGLTVDLLFAWSPTDEEGLPTGTPVKVHGQPAAAKIRVMPLKDRVAGRADVEIVLDGDRWTDWDNDTREAIIDHELTHCELFIEDGVAMTDDHDRPKIRLRKHDHEFGWFDSVVSRYGEASLEWQQYERFEHAALKQMWLPGLQDTEVELEPETAAVT